MRSCPLGQAELDEQTVAFYRRALTAVREREIPFLVGGAYALEAHTGIARHTKDFDIFVRPADCAEVLAVMAAAGYRTEMTFQHWLGKVRYDDALIDVIFGSGNGIARVDDEWFEHALPAQVFGISVELCPPEETIWSKAFVMERERYDGADVAHLLRARGEQLNWARLLRRFGPHWRVLLSHLILFGFIYPADRSQVPTWVMHELLQQLQCETHHPAAPSTFCQGTLLSRAQYLVDIHQWGYHDPRLLPDGTMTVEELARWSAAAEEPEQIGKSSTPMCSDSPQ
ncbi:MAG: nucleotidyltransferase family protein [Candidatus Entotheonellia bacterium]